MKAIPLAPISWNVVALYRLSLDPPPHNLPPHYNVCPTDPIDVVTEEDGDAILCACAGGWSRAGGRSRSGAQAATFNARDETVETKDPISI